MKQKCEMMFEPREGWKAILIDELLRLGCNMTKSQINSLIDYAMFGMEPKADFSDIKMSGALNHDAWLDRVAFFAGSVAECPIFDDERTPLGHLAIEIEKEATQLSEILRRNKEHEDATLQIT